MIPLWNLWMAAALFRDFAECCLLPAQTAENGSFGNWRTGWWCRQIILHNRVCLPPYHPPKKENKVKRGLWSDFLIMLLVPKWRTRAGLCLNLPEGENKEFGERSQRKNIRLKFPGAWQESLSSCGRTVQLMLTFDLLSVIEQKPQTKFLLEWIDVFL